MSDEEPINKKACNQWKFTHGLIKSMIMNTLTAMDYIRRTPDGVASLFQMKHLKRELTRRAYASFMIGYDDWGKDTGIDTNQGTHKLVKKGVQMIITVMETDHVYNKLASYIVTRFQTLSEEDLKKFEETEIPFKEIKHNFVFRKTRGR